jgi:hypothetical protein
MRKLNGTLIVAIAILFAAASQAALARGAKSGSILYQSTAPGIHIKDATITTRTKPNRSVKDIPVTKVLDKSSPMLR